MDSCSELGPILPPHPLSLHARELDGRAQLLLMLCAVAHIITQSVWDLQIKVQQRNVVISPMRIITFVRVHVNIIFIAISVVVKTLSSSTSSSSSSSSSFVILYRQSTNVSLREQHARMFVVFFCGFSVRFR